MLLISSVLLINQYYGIKNPKYTIAIIQSASHPSLDSARDAFIKTINNHFPNKTIEFLLYNTQGSLSSAHALASQLYNNKNINMFFTIGSLVTQAIQQLEKERPIFFAAVSSPEEIGINQATSNNITGISDMIAPKTPLYVINSICPKAKTIGLLYSFSTLNQKECQQIKIELEKNNKTVADIIINNETEIESILESNIEKYDAIISPCDNVVATAMPLIVKKMINHQKPFLTCFNEATTAGALASCGTNYYDAGEKNALNAIEVIEKTKQISDIPVSIIENNIIYCNKQTAAKINIDLPSEKNDLLIII